LNRLLSHLSYANVVSSLCLFLLLGGGAAFAASKLAKNSVGAKQLKKEAVTTAKLKKNAVTGAKIKLSSLGAVPNATHAEVAGSAESLSPPEAVHVVGAPGQPPFEGGSSNFAPTETKEPPVGFYKDREGIVHLEGYAEVGKSMTTELVQVFTLPPGYRPAPGVALDFQVGQGTLVLGADTEFAGKTFDGALVGEQGVKLALNGISFRAEG
jgi:hypothetical protein